MATVYATITAPAKGVLRDIWTITGTDDGYPESAPQYPLKTVRVTGTFAGGTVVMEESDNGSTWFTCINNAGAAVSFTANGSMVIASNAQFIRPRASVAITTATISLISTDYSG